MTASFKLARRRRAAFATAGLICLLSGCEEPQPISFAEFMDDEFARDGTLIRCNENRESTRDDLECANARRAAAAIALREERARREALELESERRIAELRAEVERERAATRLAEQRAQAAARAAYDAQWEARNGTRVGIDGQPLDASAAPLPPEAVGAGGERVAPGVVDASADGEKIGPTAAQLP